ERATARGAHGAHPGGRVHRPPHQRRPPRTDRVDNRRRRRPLLAVREAPAPARERHPLAPPGKPAPPPRPPHPPPAPAPPPRPLPADAILDDVLTPMRAVLAGYRVVFADQAIAFDQAAVDAAAERRRKVRTLAGNVQILGIEPRLLVPFVNPVWLQYMSHKVG